MNAEFLGRNVLERMGKKERILGFFDAKEMLQRTISALPIIASST
jgi:hypothetical protein